jgi:hypothetical protein
MSRARYPRPRIFPHGRKGTITFATLPAQGVSGASVPVGAPGYVTIDVTNAVRGWLNNDNSPASSTYVGGGNFGLYLTAGASGSFVLDSKENTSASHPPELNIELATDFTGVLRNNMTLTSRVHLADVDFPERNPSSGWPHSVHGPGNGRRLPGGRREWNHSIRRVSK